ncbi:biopolymer transporter ExbD [bacterium]|nr:biopolymer transporter ExbD [bacterium]
MNFSGKNHQIVPEINIVSLIDVVFLMLIFLMVSTTFSAVPGLKIKLPKAATDPVKSEKRLEVTITKEGQFYMNDKLVSLADLKTAIETKAKEMKDPVLIIHADEMARHGMVVKVMDMAKKAGLENMAIATRPESSDKSS